VRRGQNDDKAVQHRAVYQVKAEFFKTLGHPVRVRILELLKDGERSVGELQRELKMDSGGTSQHLVLDARRAGTSVFYSVRDPRIFQLLDTARQIITSNLTESQQVLGELATAG